MRETVIALFLSVLGLSILSMLAPGEGKSIRLVVGLCVIIALLVPLKELASDFSVDTLLSLSLREDKEEKESSYQAELVSVLQQAGRAELESAVAERLAAKFGMDRADFSVCADTAVINGEMRIEKIVVLLSGNAIFKNPHAISAYVEEWMGCQCAVALDAHNRNE